MRFSESAKLMLKSCLFIKEEASHNIEALSCKIYMSVIYNK